MFAMFVLVSFHITRLLSAFQRSGRQVIRDLSPPLATFVWVGSFWLRLLTLGLNFSSACLECLADAKVRFVECMNLLISIK